MTSFSVAAARPARQTIVGILGFVAALALASQIAIPMPGTPVPFTLQPLIVVLAGLWLGPLAGATSMLLYLALGTVGLPVFSPFGVPGPARFFGPTGGYLLAYPVSAFVAGWLGERAKSYGARALAAVAGVLVLLLGGLAQLAVLTGDLGTARAMGLHPFVALDLVKALIAAGIAPRRTSREHTPA